MATLKKSALATLVGAAAMAAAGAANATIVVGGENGYTFSVDGNINQFYVHQNGRKDLSGFRESRVRNGLLPTFLGFNVTAPEMNGLVVGARVSISPSTNGGSYFDGTQNGSAMEQREAFATVDGDFGQIMLGKGLGLYGSHNILMDQTLYGVGATLGGDGQTTLGRIGYGYDYANWRSQIRYTTPNMSGFQAAFAVMESDRIGQVVTDGNIQKRQPRFEVDLSYGTAFDGGSFKGWVSGMTQRVRGEYASSANVRSNAWTVGANVNFAGFDFVAAYYDNKGVGDLGGLDYASATDANGKRRDGEGYYVQAGYTFAGATKVSYSYGESELKRTSAEKAGLAPTSTSVALADLGGDIKERRMHTVGIYHDVTANLKLVAEYSRMEHRFHESDKQRADVFAVGGFISW
ncbi:outer membrane protein (porin) [Methylophaga lonarensis MPL]|uniref:Outer membrane protein (Porin) n=1 Tax=Methylophaga lonarensis MPL TaxID=1286106 RepID=M7NTP0_9GAMM|nr:porin [Methylophaga lonarensis]EMR12143.1 outer membrane protein (porin) [Methylophaga lonarensis MPL]